MPLCDSLKVWRVGALRNIEKQLEVRRLHRPQLFGCELEASHWGASFGAVFFAGGGGAVVDLSLAGVAAVPDAGLRPSES